MERCREGRWRRALRLILILALGACLLSFRLGENDFFEDEAMGLKIAFGSPSEVVLQAMRDVHPPLHFLVLRYWTARTGVSELSARSLSVLFAVLAIWMTFALARRAFSREAALLASLIVAVSPYVILYGRLARYYSFVTFLYLLSVLLLERACNRGALHWWLAYTASIVALLYTNYLGLFALPGGLVYAAWRGKRCLLRYILSLACILLAFLPLVPWMLFQSQRYGPRAWPGGLGMYVGDVIRKIAFSFYALCLGETVLFWNAVVVIPALAIFAFLFIRGLGVLLSGQREGLRIVLSFYLVPLLAIASVSSMPFIGVFSARSVALFPARVVMFAPVAYMVVAAGLCRFSARSRLALSTAVLGLFLYSLVNLYYGSEYLNEKYVSPWRAIAAFVRASAAETDFVASRENAFWFYYFDGDIERMKTKEGKSMAGTEPERVWLIERMRGDTTLQRRPRLGASFPSSYRLSSVHPFQPIGERQRKMYSRIKGREVGAFYIEARLYERVDAGEEKGKGPE